MADGDERREVAERLRERPVARNIKEAYVSIVQAVGVRPCLLSHEGESGDRFDVAAYADALDNLADLIDPVCHNQHPRASDGCFCCSECLFLYEPTDWSAYRNSFLYCPRCGARVVDDE
jgi:hypothetical protein